MISEVQQKINDDLIVLEIWLSATELSANLVRTEYIMLAISPNLKTLDFIPSIKFNGNPIKRVSKNYYLGLIIDENLSWEKYIDPLKPKMFLALMAIKQVRFLPREFLTAIDHSLAECRL